MGNSYSVEKSGESLEYKAYSDGYKLSSVETIVPSEAEWQAFFSKIDKLDVWSWVERYETPVVDGTSWSVEIVTVDRTIKSSGSNAYPGKKPGSHSDFESTPTFDKFLRTVEKLIGGLTFQ